MTFSRCPNSHNKTMKCINGNIIRLMHLNKGSSSILTKFALLSDTLDKEMPDILSLVESNCLVSEPNQVNPFPGYQTEHKLMKINNIKTGTARTTILIKDGNEYTRRQDLEPDICSLLWI